MRGWQEDLVNQTGLGSSQLPATGICLAVPELIGDTMPFGRGRLGRMLRAGSELEATICDDLDVSIRNDVPGEPLHLLAPFRRSGLEWIVSPVGIVRSSMLAPEA